MKQLIDSNCENILVISRSMFKELVSVEERFKAFKSNHAFISIHSPASDARFNDSELIAEGDDAVLNLWFSDYDPESENEFLLPSVKENLSGEGGAYGIVPFNQDHANQIKEFVFRNIDKKFWCIHCTAGVSRSGAVGVALSEVLGVPYAEFIKHNNQVKPNIHVLQILRKTFGLYPF